MLNNSGSIAGAVNKCRYGGSKRTIILEIIICAILLTIGIFLIVQWNKIQDNEINVEVSYLGPDGRQYAGMKVVRDHHNSSSTINRSEPNYVPGIYFAIATQLQTSNSTPLFSDGLIPTTTSTKSDSMYESYRLLAQWRLGDDLKTDGTDIGFITDVNINATNVKELFLKKVTCYDSISKKTIKTRNWTSSISPQGLSFDLEWSKQTKELCYFQDGGYMRPKEVLFPAPSFRLNNNSDSWISLFVRNTGVIGEYDIDEYMFSKIVIPEEKEAKIQESFNRVTRNIQRFAVKRFFDSIMNNRTTTDETPAIFIKKQIESLKHLIYDTLGISQHSGLNSTLSITTHDNDLIANQGEQSRMIQFSPIGTANDVAGYYYYHQSFDKPLFVWTMCDLSRVHDKIRFASSGTDSLTIMKFEYEYHTPIENVTCYPTPDIITATGFVFTEPSKLRYIKDKGMDVYVHFPDWDNAQTQRFFIVTLILTIIVSYLLRRLYTDGIIAKLGVASKRTLITVNVVVTVLLLCCILICFII